MEERTFSADEFVKALESGSLREPIRMLGMVRKSEKKGELLFSVGRSCENWLHIPIARVEKVEWLGRATCKDNVHEWVRLTLQDMQQEEPDLYVDLLRSLIISGATPGGSMSSLGPCGPPGFVAGPRMAPGGPGVGMPQGPTLYGQPAAGEWGHGTGMPEVAAAGAPDRCSEGCSSIHCFAGFAATHTGRPTGSAHFTVRLELEMQ